MSSSEALPVAGPMQGVELRQFLEGTWVARLSVLDERGYPYIVPLWYEFDGQSFWMVAREHVNYVQHLQHDPRCALSIAQDVSPLRRVLAQGRMEIVEGPSHEGRWLELLPRLALRYAGPGGPAMIERTRDIRRWLMRLDPERMRSFKGA